MTLLEKALYVLFVHIQLTPINIVEIKMYCKNNEGKSNTKVQILLFVAAYITAYIFCMWNIKTEKYLPIFYYIMCITTQYFFLIEDLLNRFCIVLIKV